VPENAKQVLENAKQVLDLTGDKAKQGILLDISQGLPS
jgi:hypothetical protein